MKIIHGSWFPAHEQEFIQTGQFCIWVETENKNRQSGTDIHPRHLRGKALREFLRSELKLVKSTHPLLEKSYIQQRIQLPSVNEDNASSVPLASPELSSSLDETPDKICLKPWSVECFSVELPLQAINQIYFLIQSLDAEIRPGSDFLFWYRFSRSVQQVIRKEQYIPGLLQREFSATGEAHGEIYRNWQIVSSDHEDLLAQMVKQMPPVCSQGFEPQSLLRHFSEVTINQVLDLASIKTPQSVCKKFSNTFLEDFFTPELLLGSGKELQAGYSAWYAWQQNINELTQDNRLQICFRLHEADSVQADNWSIQFIAVSGQSPAFRQELSTYWNLSAKEKQKLAGMLPEDFEHQLLLRLGAAARIYPKLWQGMRTSQPQSLQLTMDEAFAFLKETAWILEDAGFKVMIPSWWTPKGRQKARIRLRSPGKQKSTSSAAVSSGQLALDNLIDYSYELAIGDQPVTEQEWAQLVSAQTPLIQFRGQWMELEPDKMRHMLEFWHQNGTNSASLAAPDLLKMLVEQEDIYELDPQSGLAAMMEKLSDESELEQLDNPAGLNAELRDYQKRGVSWLRYLEQLGLNGCLADDMGLGKTIQVIANLVLDTESANGNDSAESKPPDQGATLLIAPTSVIGNWQKEVQKFAPQLSTAIHHGGDRVKNAADFQALCRDKDMLITSYSLARKDIKLLGQVNWQRVVLDEAQNIKNPKSAQTKAIFKLKANSRLALTGTPVENRLMDLWSIFNFLNPGYLGTQAQFRKAYESPIQQEHNSGRSALLKKLVGPFILRRMKTDKNIIKDLPDKLENKQYCNLSKEQAAFYEVVVKETARQLEEKEGIERQGLMLSTLMQLKQICNHPMQFLQDGSEFSAERSNKLERICDMLDEVQAEGESALIFTQFTEIGEQLVRYLEQKKRIRCFYLHGGVARSKREAMIREFQDPATEPAVFVLSLKAGGVGITLTRANHVFHFDRWWNPAVEDQATDRAFRIGQDKSVFVHKFITAGTLEERIDQMIEDKKRVADSIVGNDESWLAKLDNETFKELIALNRQSIME
ncbi:DEAD/DEAH box helicase [Vibrio sp. JC009]|uniref:DEAD/DEAH box helicase n=1 Tax=Vibrio sp. JC009 TaxID=2912314 RepID=UPI0023B1A658|nr:DEAD/DEAH box helicase [Vibrio sp. JC009]WED24001.1 DEAD/DEAH box helicase [Vibrio sp. JC009]